MHTINLFQLDVKSYLPLRKLSGKMGSSQSSYAKNVKGSSVKKSPSFPSVRGRKSINGGSSAPHGLTASFVSVPSEDLRDELDVTAAESVHSDDAQLHECVEEYEEDESESELEEDEGMS